VAVSSRLYAAEPSDFGAFYRKGLALATPEHLLLKLRWEIKNFQRSSRRSSPKDMVPAYHAFNCAVTAWHMTDWVWEYLAPQSQAELAKRLSLRASTLRSFQDAIALSSRALNACQEIANGSKHRKVRRPQADPDVHAGIQVVEITSDEPGLPINPPGRYRYRLLWVIRDRAGVRPALDVFKEAAYYWDDFLRRWLLFTASKHSRRRQ
jgi:hypothetical protein